MALGHPGPHPKLRGGGLLSIELANLSLLEVMEILRVQFISHQHSSYHLHYCSKETEKDSHQAHLVQRKGLTESSSPVVSGHHT